MDARRLLPATLLALAGMAGLAALWQGLVLPDFYADHAPLRRPAPLLRLLVLGSFVLAVLVAASTPRATRAVTRRSLPRGRGGPFWRYLSDHHITL